MAAVMYRGRSIRSRRLRGRQDCGDEDVKLDYSKKPCDNLREVLTSVVKCQGISKAKKLNYYNAFVRFCFRLGNKVESGFTKEEILCCLRPGLVHEAKEMRAACLRALRYCCQDEEAVLALLRLRLDYLIARSLDICLDNDVERIHALRLMRKIVQLCPHRFPASMLHVLIAIANDGNHERDRMVKTCLATLCELAFHIPRLLCECGGISSILKNVLDCHHLPRVNESLLAAVLHIMNHPRTRHYIKPNVDLEQILAPFTDCHYKYIAETTGQGLVEDSDNRFSASKMAIATIIKSWPGIIKICKPDGTGLQSLIGVLYLPNMDTRKDIMDIFYDVFRLPVPVWTANFSEALVSVDPSEMRESWRLVEGFVAEEGKSILFHLGKTRPDLVDNHMALILSAFISAGLLEALVGVITTSDDHIFIRAVILLGEVLHLANTILPHESSQHSHCLPTLISWASSFDVSLVKRNRATMAVTCLSRLHVMKKRGPIPCSLYLEQVLHSASTHKQAGSTHHPLTVGRETLLQYLDGKDLDREIVPVAIKESQVLTTKDNWSWDWDLITSILKWPGDNLAKVDDQSYTRFLRRILYFFKPNNKLFSTSELKKETHRKCVTTGLNFVDFLLESKDEECKKIIDEWMSDICQSIAEVTTHKDSTELLFSPSALMSTCSQYYFLYIGRFSAHPDGHKILENTGIYQHLLDLLTNRSQDTYVKLTASCLDYTQEGIARIILSKALTATSESARQYATSFLRVLFRAEVPDLENWAIELLVMQLYDQSKAVAMEALSVISEACEKDVNLNVLIKLRPAVLHLGHKGAMLLARFLSIPSGFKFLSDVNYIQHELHNWHTTFNVKYVLIVEERLNEAMTTYEKTYDGSYVRRSHRRQPRKDVFVPVHLYGQLVQLQYGCQLLEKQEYLCEYFDTIRYQQLKTDEEVLKLKAALWALGHIGTSTWGIDLLQEQFIIPEIIKLAEECGVFSVRGTAYFAAGMLACTSKGANILSSYGWESVRHNRQDLWPVLDDAEIEEDDTMAASVSYLSLCSGSKPDGLRSPASGLPTVTLEDLTHPLQEEQGPRACFYIDGGETSDGSESIIKSRSNTGSSHNIGVSHENSPLPSLEHLCGRRTSDKKVEANHISDALEDLSPTETKGRSTSMPESTVANKEDEIHPRSQSDPPLTVTERQSNGHAAVHFRDVDSLLSKQKLARDYLVRKRSGSSNGGDVNSGRTMQIKAAFGSFGKDDHSSIDSARTTPTTFATSTTASKSRSDSFNTDTTTSGVSSYESGHHPTIEPGILTPIPSASSVVTDTGTSIDEEHKPKAHPSESLRKMANLKRVPSMKRRFSNPVLGHLSAVGGRSTPHSDMAVPFSSSRDFQGYATLRELQKHRAQSMEVENKPSNIFDDKNVPKASSLDFRIGRPSSNVRQLSTASLQDVDAHMHANTTADSLQRHYSTANLRKLQSLPGRPEYIGISLPVDISMFFQVHEGEDKRSYVPPDEVCTMLKTKVKKLSKPARSVSQSEEEEAMEYHSNDMCLGCYRVRKIASQNNSQTGFDPDCEDVFHENRPQDSSRTGTPSGVCVSPSPPGHAALASKKFRTSSLTETSGTRPSSMSSITSIDSTARLADGRPASRGLVRKEIVHLVVNLSSSVGTKTNEQSLLVLKQKFPREFQDVCFYSEICCLLANYRYRLNARRFIQELFYDVDFSVLFEEPRKILDMEEEPPEDDMMELDVRLEKVEETAD